jgi:microcystin-dependent protein
MSEPFLGQIRMFAGNFAPRSNAFCNGQLLPISQNTALFSLLGTTYGGDGRTTFGLPDLRGRVTVHAGQGPGLTYRPLGQKSGTQDETLNTTQLASHTHSPDATTDDAAEKDPTNRVLGRTAAGNFYATADPATDMNSAAILADGGGQSHDNMMPWLGIYFIIALQGIFPSRN